MLPAANRMTRSADFGSVVRGGRRVRTGTLVVHTGVPASSLPAGGPPIVGLVVSRGVGGSVVRNRVSRRLRAQLCARLGQLPAGSGTVVRALPRAAVASSTELAQDLDRALVKVRR